MIAIILLLIFSLSMFLLFDYKRKSRNRKYRNAKKEKLTNLLEIIRQDDDEKK